MLRKDLLQQLEMPAHFDQAGRPDLGCAPNLSVMMIAMGGLETMATLAKIGGVVANGNATETVKRFADRYFQHVNPLYARPVGQSLIRLLWDAYRNGGLHRFFPKAGTVQIGGRQVDVRFGVSWYEVAVAGEKRSATLSEARAARASTPALTVLSIGPDSYNVWLVAQFFVLDFIDAVERWAGELTPAAPSASGSSPAPATSWTAWPLRSTRNRSPAWQTCSPPPRRWGSWGLGLLVSLGFLGRVDREIRCHEIREIRCPAAHNAVGLAGESPAVGIDCLSTWSYSTLIEGDLVGYPFMRWRR